MKNNNSCGCFILLLALALLALVGMWQILVMQSDKVDTFPVLLSATEAPAAAIATGIPNIGATVRQSVTATPHVVYAIGSVNLRAECSANADILHTVLLGEQVRIIGAVGAWVEAEHEGVAGCMLAACVGFGGVCK